MDKLRYLPGVIIATVSATASASPVASTQSNASLIPNLEKTTQLSASALQQITSRIERQANGTVIARGTSFVQLGDPWMQWRSQVKKHTDDTRPAPSGNVTLVYRNA